MRLSAIILPLLSLLRTDAFQSTSCCTTSGRVATQLHASNPTRSPLNGSRRDLLVEAGGLAFSSLILGSPLPGFADTGNPKTIVVTGANSGIGFEACKRLAKQGNTLVLACRTMAKAKDTAETLQELGGKSIPAECNLASAKSIEAFAKELPSLVGNSKLDTVCLNAGLARNTAAKDVARTEDGFELTVGTNHFGHFYLNNLLLPMIKPAGGKIVVTASGVHDPESPGGAQGSKATLGDLQGLEREGGNCEMIDGGAFDPDKAYKDSKVSFGVTCAARSFELSSHIVLNDSFAMFCSPESSSVDWMPVTVLEVSQRIVLIPA